MNPYSVKLYSYGGIMVTEVANHVAHERLRGNNDPGNHAAMFEVSAQIFSTGSECCLCALAMGFDLLSSDYSTGVRAPF